MAWSTADLIAQFRLTITAMPTDVVSDEELASDIDIYRDYVSERRFGRLFPKALSDFIAHMRTLNDMIAAAVSAGGNAGDSSLLVGVITSEKEGELSRSYATPSTSSSSEYDAVLKKTMYGQLFLQLRAMVCVSATVRIGVGRGGCGYR